MSISTPRAGSYEDLVSELSALIGPLNDLLRQKAAAYAPIVRDLIRSRSRDVSEIERTLDHLLDCACIPEGLDLFKALCRYYFTLNPSATAYYVNAYREIWDNENNVEMKGETP